MISVLLVLVTKMATFDEPTEQSRVPVLMILYRKLSIIPG